VSSTLLDGTITQRNLTVEIFYPAVMEPSAKPYQLDFRALLTDKINKKIPDSAIPVMHYNQTFQALKMDISHGPFPVIVFVHGTAGWRTQSLNLQSHWASRGFVVVAAE
jgi:predicted dienelactone hydrolase